MSTVVTDKQKLMKELENATSTFVKNVDMFTAASINTKPFPGSWSAAQVADHVTKSNASISKALQLGGQASNREPDERVAELRTVFLNFDTKLNAPSFIIPSEDILAKDTLLATLAHSISKLVQVIHEQDMSSMINHPAFGDITKWEVAHFVIFHTQRHTHQLQNIFRALSK